MFARQHSNRNSFFSSTGTSLLILVLLLVSAVIPEDSSKTLPLPCHDNGAFHCASGDPGSFTRCVETVLHVFLCPKGLHFNMQRQMCDWPFRARCSVHGTASEKVEHAGEVLDDAEPCHPSQCPPPLCRCPECLTPSWPGPLSTPQMVMLTFDDQVTAAHFPHFQRLFRAGRNNPNGCAIKGCFFVSGSGTDFDLVRKLYKMGMEIASHTLTHRHPFTWWGTATYQDYVEEADGMRKKLVSEAGLPHDAVRGFRVPYLQVGGDNMFRALHDFNFTYDSSILTKEGVQEYLWPFTLDVPLPKKFCQHRPCPVKPYPGLWEIPLQRWYGADGSPCPMLDSCSDWANDVEKGLDFFRSNFKRYYEANRAPLGMFLHAGWFQNKVHLEVLDAFMDELLLLKDVFFVTPSQVVAWMKAPTAVDQLASFKPWACETSNSKISTK